MGRYMGREARGTGCEILDTSTLSLEKCIAHVMARRRGNQPSGGPHHDRKVKLTHYSRPDRSGRPPQARFDPMFTVQTGSVPLDAVAFSDVAFLPPP
jgi:hypothetical protein